MKLVMYKNPFLRKIKCISKKILSMIYGWIEALVWSVLSEKKTGIFSFLIFIKCLILKRDATRTPLFLLDRSQRTDPNPDHNSSQTLQSRYQTHTKHCSTRVLSHASQLGFLYCNRVFSQVLHCMKRCPFVCIRIMYCIFI